MSNTDKNTLNTSCKQQARVMLWSAPRCLSTAFERSIMQLDNSKVYNEFYTAAYFFGPHRVWAREFMPLAPHLSRERVKTKLESEHSEAQVIFAKDFAFTLQGRHDMIPEGFTHTFLIRDPMKMFTSLKPRLEASRLSRAVVGTDLMKCIQSKGYAIKEMYDLFEYLRQHNITPIVLDADDLLEDPEGMMRKYCQHTGIPFDEKMMSWEPKKMTQMTWHCAKVMRLANWLMGWYNGALNSTQFQKPSTPREIDFDTLSEDVRTAIDVTTPYYRYLYEFRLRPDTASSPVVADALENISQEKLI
ncbi:uncharacterized protein [Amphiura filiformis]|uniref:uncharacterized protein n=1 Tax=Amphiura filiformis TaxID=82378 RepID=UPI003B216E3A